MIFLFVSARIWLELFGFSGERTFRMSCCSCGRLKNNSGCAVSGARP